MAVKRSLRNLITITIFLGYNRNEKNQNRTENQIKSHLYDIRDEKTQLNPFIENVRKKVARISLSFFCWKRTFSCRLVFRERSPVAV